MYISRLTLHKLAIKWIKKTCHDHAFELAEEIRKVTKNVNSDSRNLLMVDMEDSSVTEESIKLHEALTEAFLPAAITLQAYLFRAENELQKIVKNGGAVRLVKGAFAEGKDRAFTGRSAID